MTDHQFVPMTFVFPHPGREQAELTGKRLAALGLKYDVLIHSSMARATETAHIISRHLPGIRIGATSEITRIPFIFDFL